MKIAIGLPATLARVTGNLLLDWAREADVGPFSSLAVIDRLVYHNFDALTTLTAAAGATRRIRLMTSVLLAPLYPAALLAKQLASLDALSNGRLTVGWVLEQGRTIFERSLRHFIVAGNTSTRNLN